MRTGLKPPTFSTIYFASKISISTGERRQLREKTREAALLSSSRVSSRAPLARNFSQYPSNRELAGRLSTIKLQIQFLPVDTNHGHT